MHQQHQAEGEQQHPKAATAFAGLSDQQRRGPHQHSPHHGRLHSSADQKDQHRQRRQGKSKGTSHQATQRQCRTQQHGQVEA